MNNGKTDKPDPEQHARVVLWHLCYIEASLQDLAAGKIRESGQQSGASEQAIFQETANYARRVRKTAELLYQNALEQSNIKPSPKFPYPPGT